jgi:plasmid stabilization system protein ParE
MTFVVRELPRAKQDKENIFRWLSARSPVGALAWLDAYDAALARLANEAGSFSVAPENADSEFDVRQVLFKTRRGRVYRLLFFIEGETAFILRVRGAGQAPVNPTDVA